MEWSIELIFAVVALLGSVGSFIGIFIVKPSEKADTAQKWQNIASEAAEDVTKMREDIKELRKENKDMRVECDALWKDHREMKANYKEMEKGLGILINQLGELEVVPRWQPKKK